MIERQTIGWVIGWMGAISIISISMTSLTSTLSIACGYSIGVIWFISWILAARKSPNPDYTQEEECS